MSAITATGPTTVIASGFAAYGETDQSEGRRGTREIGSFTTVEEAIEAARGQGTQGDPGNVSSFKWLLHAGGAVTRRTTPLIGRRRTPEGYYQIGWLDLREYDEALLTGPEPDNAQPHPVTLTVKAREATVTIDHPQGCSGHMEECPAQDVIENVGPEDFLHGFGPLTDLDDEALAALDGTVKHVIVTSTTNRWSNAEGENYDVDYDFEWSTPVSRRVAVRYILIDLAVTTETRQALWTKPLSSPDLSDLYELALDRIDGLYDGTLTPEQVLAEIDDDEPVFDRTQED